ncbi:MAG: Spy/CpxP family protein refolding chaperone [Syntrophales bacterium]
MKAKKLMTTVAILAVVLMATTTWAYGPGGGRGWGRGPCYNAADVGGPVGLNLTADQNEKIRALRVAHQKEVQPLQAAMFAKRGELRTLWLETTPNEEKILKVNRDIDAIRTQLNEKATKHRLQMLNVLTPEQKAQIQSRGPGFGRGFGPGAGAGYDGWGTGRGQGRGMGPRGW